MKIEAILKQHARPATSMAAEPVKPALLDDLRAQKRAHNILYGCLFGILCLLSVLAIGAIFTDLFEKSTARTGILAGAGVGIPALLEWMRRVIREWGQLTLLVTLVSHSDEAAVQALIRKLLANSAALGAKK